MKKKRFAKTITILLVLIAVAALLLPQSSNLTAHAQTPDAESTAGLQPVEDDMHEFMEYVFQPTYKRLKASMAGTEKDGGAWKSIKSDSLILAEGGNLLLIRSPKSDSTDWNEHAKKIREFGGQLYRAAKQKDEPQSQKVYRMMLDNCNACHQQFADGEHQLKP